MTAYDSDILLWSETQAALLRRIAAGERINDLVDWENVIEEIESVGRSELAAVESTLTQMLAHMLKITAWPQSPHVRHWRKEMLLFRRQLHRKFRESMRAKIDLAELYGDALLLVPDDMDGQAPQHALPQECPVTLDELLRGTEKRPVII